MSKQSEIDRWWRLRLREFDAVIGGGVEVSPAAAMPKAPRSVSGAPAQSSQRRFSGRTSISVLAAVAAATIMIAYQRYRFRRKDPTDWEDWAANAESNGGRQ